MDQEEPKYKKLSVIVPALNEAERFEHVVLEALKLSEVGELIFVDDGSTDDTGERAKIISDSRFIYLGCKTNKGKGAALRLGLKKAKNEIILFLDADLINITARKIKKIFDPVLRDEVDFSRGSFKLARGRVTEIAVKPMMKILFPEIYFDQPISGQVCAKKSFLETVSLESRWGVDIGILLDAITAGQRIIEIDIGRLEHKARSLDEKAEMAQQVLETMIQKAGLIQHKYKIVVFSLDNTLVEKNALRLIFEKLKLGKEITELQDAYKKEEMTFTEFTKSVTDLFMGMSTEQIAEICQKVPFVQYASEVIRALKKRKYRVALVSSNFSPIVVPIAKKLGIELVDCIYLEEKNGKLNGRILAKSKERWIETEGNPFEKAFLRIIHKAQVKATEAIIVANSPKCLSLFSRAGLSIAYKPADKLLREKADKTIKILPELLAIIE